MFPLSAERIGFIDETPAECRLRGAANALAFSACFVPATSYAVCEMFISACRVLRLRILRSATRDRSFGAACLRKSGRTDSFAEFGEILPRIFLPLIPGFNGMR